MANLPGFPNPVSTGTPPDRVGAKHPPYSRPRHPLQSIVGVYCTPYGGLFFRRQVDLLERGQSSALPIHTLGLSLGKVLRQYTLFWGDNVFFLFICAKFERIAPCSGTIKYSQRNDWRSEAAVVDEASG